MNTLIYKEFSFHSTLFSLGKRYSLNQNIPSNLVDGFWLLDLSMAYNFLLKSSKLTIQLGIRNVTDRDYVFIRSFVMPGRNYFLQLRYEF
jgi:outer membrane receptor protein involved in Fe transport